MKIAVMIVAVGILTASCASRHGNDRPEVVEAGLGASVGPQPQTTCPVMDGKRINNRLYVDYKGFRIYVCCNPCVKAARKDPAKYLKKLRDQGIAVETVEKTVATASIAEGFVKQSNRENDR